MRVISKAAIREFSERHPDALEPLLHWHRITKRASWRSRAEVRRDFRRAHFVGAYVVFNIAGNKYRLIAAMHYNMGVVYALSVLTHSEYSRGTWRARL